MENKNSGISVNIQDTKYRIEGSTTYCDMTVKVNLNNFEEKYFIFTQPFIKKVLSEHLPVVMSIINYSYSDTEPVVAKYYITPGGDAKVLKFDRYYYKKVRRFSNEELVKVGDIIPVKQMVTACNECVEYDYCETFKVTGKAVCLSEDVFDEKIGRAISSWKATSKAVNRLAKLYSALMARTETMNNSLKQEYLGMLRLVANTNRVLESNKERY